MSAENQQKIAVVTGASRGLGRALAFDLAARNYTVVLGARNEAELRDLARDIAAGGGKGGDPRAGCHVFTHLSWLSTISWWQRPVRRMS